MISSDSFRFENLSQKDVQALAVLLAGQAEPCDVIALSGDLGAGKTVFAKAFIRSLTNPDEDVLSPTFTLVQTYEARRGERELILWHFDLYRLKTAQEIYETGFEEALTDGISLIEWPERAGGLLPRNKLTVHLEAPADQPEKRNVTVTANTSNWIRRMENIKECLNV